MCRSVIQILVGVLRHYVTLLLSSSPAKQKAAAIREQRLLTRSTVLRSSTANSPLHPSQYRAFSTSIAAALTSGDYLKPKPKEESSAANPFEGAQMEGMMDGLKKQAVMMCASLTRYPDSRS